MRRFFLGLLVLALPLLLLPGLVLLVPGIASEMAPAGTVHSGALALPSGWQALDASAAATCPGLSWTVLAAIGTVESMNGQSTLPGVASGSNSAGAQGPFQFEAATFAAVGIAGPGGVVPPSPYDPIDAAYSAAHVLCLDGAGRPATLSQTIYAYNHSTTYVQDVETLALAYSASADLTQATVVMLEFAADQLGVPYLWGGEGPGGFDCSGLVQAAARAAGVSLARTAQAQYDAGPLLPAGSPPQPGDLVFFGTGPDRVTHVGIALGSGEMLDAPHAGAEVEIESDAWPDLVGVTQPI